MCFEFEKEERTCYTCASRKFRYSSDIISPIPYVVSPLFAIKITVLYLHQVFCFEFCICGNR